MNYGHYRALPGLAALAELFQPKGDAAGQQQGRSPIKGYSGGVNGGSGAGTTGTGLSQGSDSAKQYA